MNEWQQHIGVGQPHYGLARTGPTRQRKIIRQEGRSRGTVAAIETDHADGRVDATVFPEGVHRKLSVQGE